MKKGKSKIKKRILVILSIMVFPVILIGFSIPTTLIDFFFPGSQDGESGTLESPSNCANCHGGFDKTMEPTFNWIGSMMAQAARDPLYEACLTIANQDVPFSGDVCIRCHSPEGWLAGRSIPTDGSALTTADREGVHCGFCHRLVKPTSVGINPYPSDQFYTDNTYAADQKYLATIQAIPTTPGNGSFIVDSDNTKRGPFTDAGAKHKIFYAPYHSQSDICGICHDVSNPVYSRNPDGTYSANSFNQAAPSLNTYDLFPVERTYSEWLKSTYNTPGGVYAPQFGGNKQFVSTCQDCHLKDITGYAANKSSAVLRTNLPFHDMTGGNTFIPKLVKLLFPGVNQEALDSGIVRAEYMLRNAATLDVTVNINAGQLTTTVRVTNQTGHKLPSGYPEGRRIWINLIARNTTGDIIYESGHYEPSTGVLTKDTGIKIYEIKPGVDETMASLTGLPAGPTFHFVVNNKIWSDNRIPPRGFTNANFESIQSPPVNYTYADGQYWDETVYNLPPDAAFLEVKLLYQTASKEYIDFLKTENITNNSGQILYDLWAANGKSAPEVMAQKTVDIPATGTNEKSRMTVTVYPNPAEEWITFRFPEITQYNDLEVSLIDARGVYAVKSQKLIISGDEARYNIGKLRPGRYIFVIENRNTVQVFRGKIVVK